MIRQGSGNVTQSGEGMEIYKDTYFYFAIPLVIILFLEIMIVVRRGRL